MHNRQFFRERTRENGEERRRGGWKGEEGEENRARPQRSHGREDDSKNLKTAQ